MKRASLSFVITILALTLALWSIYRLESARWSIEIEDVVLGQTPATFYSTEGSKGALVVVSHGFGGSRQMMEAISLTLAQAGHTAVAFDYIGHGRHSAALSPAIETLTGTTEDLVRQTLGVVEAAQLRTGLTRVSYVGHSMATDVIVRAAARLPETKDVVAISMYSDAITPTHPERLLVVSGAFEGRLREVSLAAVGQVGPAQEGETVTNATVARRAVSAPMVGHVGVLWSPLTLSETARWLGDRAAPVAIGKWIAALLLSILILFQPLVRLLPATDLPHQPGIGRAALAASVAAIGAGGIATTGLPVLGVAGFGALGLAFGVWGILVLMILRVVPRFSGLDLFAGLLLVVWGLGAFALALDRYGAAFLPMGPRLSLALILLPSTLLFGLADRILVQGRGLGARIALRVPFLVAFTLAMIVAPTALGLVFTVLPVLVLYWLVYGTMAMWLAQRSGPIGAGLGAGVILAWAIAASTPLFQA
ncbi:alpha/beta fold hydrolase [Jannaschia donghaensis]|uniref:Acetoin dehydrogenase E2 subunit dihydrolipoyllysine-residue acetyltransferase n=1 Tax=Jannaschia donghaensis TaxID=420998 RepID=A0A0M6YLP1_9RHOB|nr:alpha/beta fold hydrolase [Jannaschia donghaensis]CTQ51282.1 acetoin dehydrogenase E2 subunit dihydrolipoyllysine-residue acetyltransferase [Jannaschia donghaensis]